MARPKKAETLQREIDNLSRVVELTIEQAKRDLDRANAKILELEDQLRTKNEDVIKACVDLGKMTERHADLKMKIRDVGCILIELSPPND